MSHPHNVTEGQNRALQLAEGLPPTANNLSRVAAETSVEESRWAFQQWALRERGRAKFHLADRMLFDRDGLEMATHEKVAAYHASRFGAGEPVLDLTCGIGADLIALAARGSASGFELEPERAQYASHNLAVHQVEGEVIVGDSLESAWGAEYAFCDPARRRDGKRTLAIGAFSPDPGAIAERLRKLRMGGIKLSPMLPDAELESFGGELEFISFGGECREALVWVGSEVAGPKRYATHVESGERIYAGGDPAAGSEPRQFLYEADPAAIRAHCLRNLCTEFTLLSVGDSNGYLTGDELASSVWLKPYEVLACHNADIKRTAGELRRLGGGTPVVKSRGVRLDVDKLRRDLRGEGEELVVVVYPEGQSLRHAICRRV